MSMTDNYHRMWKLNPTGTGGDHFDRGWGSPHTIPLAPGKFFPSRRKRPSILNSPHRTRFDFSRCIIDAHRSKDIARELSSFLAPELQCGFDQPGDSLRQLNGTSRDSPQDGLDD
jgi:hypothetical protein